jgi:hypothetical protein
MGMEEGLQGEEQSTEALQRALRVAEGLPEGGLFAGLEWRVAPEPWTMPESLARDLPKLGHRLWKFLKACNLLYQRSVKGTAPAWIAQVLDQGKPRDVIEVGRSAAFRGNIPDIIRPDVIPTANGYIVSEIDSVPGGIGLTAWFNSIYTQAGASVLGGATGMLDKCAALFPQGGQIFVSEEAATYRPEMEWLASELRRSTGREIHVVGQDFPGPWGPSVYRFFELFDLPNLPAWKALREAAEEKQVRLTAPPKAFLEEKLWFALFWMRPLEPFWREQLGSGIFQALRRHLPRTWLLDPRPLPPSAVYPGLEINDWRELKNFTQKQRQLVIKVSGFSEQAWGARGVWVGHDLSAADWGHAVDDALANFASRPCILQQFHAGAQFPGTYLDADNKTLRTFPARVRLSPYFFAEETTATLGGALATLCPADKKILHGMPEAILCPAASFAPRHSASAASLHPAS